MKTYKLTGPALDWAAELALGTHWSSNGYFCHSATVFNRDPKHAYSTDWAQGGPILTDHKISRTINHTGLWIAFHAHHYGEKQRHMQCDRSELVAGLRCLVAMKLGDEIEIPEGLL